MTAYLKTYLLETLDDNDSLKKRNFIATASCGRWLKDADKLKGEIATLKTVHAKEIAKLKKVHAKEIATLKTASETPKLHWGFVCDVSGQSPIEGERYEKVGEDFDVCKDVFDKLSPKEKAKYKVIHDPIYTRDDYGRQLDRQHQESARVIAEKDREHAQVIADKDRELDRQHQESAKVIAEKDRQLEESAQVIADKDRELDRQNQESAKVIAEKDRQIAQQTLSLDKQRHVIAGKDRLLAQQTLSLDKQRHVIADKDRQLEESAKVIAVKDRKAAQAVATAARAEKNQAATVHSVRNMLQRRAREDRLAATRRYAAKAAQSAVQAGHITACKAAMAVQLAQKDREHAQVIACNKRKIVDLKMQVSGLTRAVKRRNQAIAAAIPTAVKKKDGLGHFFVRLNDMGAWHLFLKAGGPVDVKNGAGETPLDLA